MIISENTRSKLRDILSVMLPIFVTQLAVMGMSFFDTVMSGQAGAADLAGVAIGANIWMPFFTSLNGILIALMPIVAQHVGAGQREEISHAVMHGIYLAFIIGALVIIFVRSFSKINFVSGMPKAGRCNAQFGAFISRTQFGLVKLISLISSIE